MLKNVIVALLSVGALGVGAPTALADEPIFDCELGAIRHSAIGGFEGSASGYVAHAGDLSATIRCFVKVNGTEVSSTPASTATTVGRLSFWVGETDYVTFHAEACTSHGCDVRDYQTVVRDWPPQDIRDFVGFVWSAYLCPSLCPLGVRPYAEGVSTLQRG